MRTKVEVELQDGGEWMPAELTDERGYTHPVVILHGEHKVRGPMEVLFVRPRVGSDSKLLAAAASAGFTVCRPSD
jgi:hypothetical protein